MCKSIIATAIIFVSLNSSAEEVSMSVKCGPTEAVLSVMKKYGEQPLLKLSTDNTPLYIFANAKTQTWSIMYVDTDNSCVIATGTGLQTPNKKGTSL